MLLLTDTASQVICSLVDRPELPTGAGLRISTTGNGTEPLAVATAAEPEAADQVVEEQGARVFIDAGAAAILDDKVLDARVTDGGNVQFVLATQ
jgi:Fe-S cluster assembly iron-binding protein IscA